MGDWEISYFSMIVLLYFAFVACLVHPLEMRAEICTLLPSTEGNEGLVELTLSANHGVTHLGWTQLAIAIAANSQLQNLYLDYNNISDYGAGELSVNVSVELIGQISDCLSLKFQGSADNWESPKKSLEDDHSNQVA